MQLLIGFNSGHYQSIDLGEWIAKTPKDILKGNFHVFDELVNQLPDH
ncbi:hypothetical protein [Larkinella arboricola]|nr:hypothetical protein [Larkinella arboricola]